MLAGVGQRVAHPVGVEWIPSTAARARLTALARRLKSASTLVVPRTRARRPPCRRRMTSEFAFDFGAVGAVVGLPFGVSLLSADTGEGVFVGADRDGPPVVRWCALRFE